MTLRAPDDDWATAGYDRSGAAQRRQPPLAHLAGEPGPTIGGLLATEPDQKHRPPGTSTR